MSRTSSRIAGFYRRPLAARRALVRETGLLSPPAAAALEADAALPLEVADRMSENVIGTHGLPLALGLNFTVEGVDHLVPMAVEEPSVVAAASNAARLVRARGGFRGAATPAEMTAQIQFDGVPDADRAVARVGRRRRELLALGDAAIPAMVARGGGCRDLEVRTFERAPDLVVVHVHIGVGDAMGANTVDEVAEAMAGELHALVGGRLGLRILTNLPLRRMVWVEAEVATADLGGDDAARALVQASRFAEVDPMRAVTHNKGIMNGIDAVALALGQDFRAIEAAAHAYAAMGPLGYRPLAVWRRRDDGVVGRLELPLAVGTVGGATRCHPGVRAAFELIAVDGARQLAVVMAAVGLASNLAALKALTGEGIQKGHMRLHRRRQEADVGEATAVAASAAGGDGEGAAAMLAAGGDR